MSRREIENEARMGVSHRSKTSFVNSKVSFGFLIISMNFMTLVMCRKGFKGDSKKDNRFYRAIYLLKCKVSEAEGGMGWKAARGREGGGGGGIQRKISTNMYRYICSDFLSPCWDNWTKNKTDCTQYVMNLQNAASMYREHDCQSSVIIWRLQERCNRLDYTGLIERERETETQRETEIGE